MAKFSRCWQNSGGTRKGSTFLQAVHYLVHENIIHDSVYGLELKKKFSIIPFTLRLSFMHTWNGTQTLATLPHKNYSNLREPDSICKGVWENGHFFYLLNQAAISCGFLLWAFTSYFALMFLNLPAIWRFFFWTNFLFIRNVTTCITLSTDRKAIL